MPMLDPDRWAPPIAIAHRGSRLLWPENTMEAFTGAMDLGYGHLETDLHITLDGVLTCIHDDTVDRTTNGSGDVASFSFEELEGLDAGHNHRGPNGYEYRGGGIRIPRLEDLVTSFPDASLVVDLKVDGLVGPLARMIEALALHDRLIVGSLSDQRLAEFREATDGRVPVSTGPTLTRIWLLTSRAGRGGGGQAAALQVPTQMRGARIVDRRLVDTAHAHGLQVHVWTVNDRKEMEDLLALGVDGIITDRPDVLKDLLVERGQWN